jgi:HEAT repeat protein
MPQKNFLKMLAGGDRRSIGRATQVAATVLQSPSLFSQLIRGLWSADALVRMRAADAVEKISRDRPELLRPYKKELLGLMQETAMKQRGRGPQIAPVFARDGVGRRPRAELLCNRSRRNSSQATTTAVGSKATEGKEVRWHLAQIAARLPLNAREHVIAVAALKDYLEDRSSIVRTFALQALADLAHEDAALRSEVIQMLQQAVRNGTAAMKARSRKLLLRLEDH